MKIKVVSDGTAHGTLVSDAVTGEPVSKVKSLKIEMSIDPKSGEQTSICEITLLIDHVEFEGEARVKEDRPFNPEIYTPLVGCKPKSTPLPQTPEQLAKFLKYERSWVDIVEEAMAEGLFRGVKYDTIFLTKDNWYVGIRSMNTRYGVIIFMHREGIISKNIMACMSSTSRSAEPVELEFTIPKDWREKYKS